MTQDSVFTVKEAASFLKVSEMTVLRLASRGKLPGAKIGRQWRFSKEAVVKLVRQQDLTRPLRHESDYIAIPS